MGCGLACNYGAHEEGTPVLALSIELDSSHIGDRDDFIPCYYSIDDCSNFQVGLLGLESDAEPEDQFITGQELTIIFEATEADFASNKTDLGTGADNAGTVITSPNLNGIPCGEYWLNYNFEDFEVHNSFGKGKKMKIVARFSTWEFCPTSSSRYAGGKKVFNKLIKLNKGKKKDITGSKTPTLNFKNKTIFYSDAQAGGSNFGYPRNNWPSTGGQSYVNWGIVYERDWFSLKKKYVMTCSGQEVKLKGRMRRKKGMYASFYFDGDWCQRAVKEFKNRPGVGDQNSYVQIGTSAGVYNFNTHYN